MNKLITTASCFALADAALAADSNSVSCTPVATALRTDYPKYSQELGFGGSLNVGVKLDAQGKVVAARVIKSSGKAALDHAALASARQHWRFSMSTCTTSDLDREFLQAVTYRPTRGLPFSGAVDRKATRRIQAATADDRCSTVQQSHETTVTACRGANRDPRK